MYRPEVGTIDFRYGVSGDAAANYKGGKGFAKIDAKHGRAAALRVPEIIARGQPLPEPKGSNRLVLVLDGWRVVLTREKSRDPAHWVLTAYLPESEKAGEREAGK